MSKNANRMIPAPGKSLEIFQTKDFAVDVGRSDIFRQLSMGAQRTDDYQDLQHPPVAASAAERRA